MTMLPGEAVPIGLITAAVMALLALASGALYALHLRDERRFACAMAAKAAKAELNRVDFRGAWRGTALVDHAMVVSFSLMRANDPRSPARAWHDGAGKARVKQTS
jgi:hypothetical protein